MTRSSGKPWRIVYWFWETPETLRDLIKAAGYKCTLLRDLPCAALRRDNPVIVAPGAWDKTCARQGSWYRASEKNGAVLLVSPVFLEVVFENAAVKGCLAATLDFERLAAPRSASPEEIGELLEDSVFRDIAPRKWFQTTRRQSVSHVKLAERFGAEVSSWQALFAIQTANHANFITPKLTVSVAGEPTPCSIYPTAYLCSCCLQLFRVMETNHKAFLVLPCPGGVIYGKLSPHRYIRVNNYPQFAKPA